jgi:predicted nucleic-acid-binding Zn-ribbon protein
LRFPPQSKTVTLIHFRRQYERTCKECGYSWIVTRKEATLHVRPPSVRRGIAGSFAAQEASIEDQAEMIAQFMKCEKCGSMRFSERAISKRHPADPPKA